MGVSITAYYSEQQISSHYTIKYIYSLKFLEAVLRAHNPGKY